MEADLVSQDGEIECIVVLEQLEDACTMSEAGMVSVLMSGTDGVA